MATRSRNMLEPAGLTNHDEYAPTDGDLVRGNPAAVMAVGDEVVGEILLLWHEGNCRYSVWVGPGLTVEEARDYAARY